LIGYRRMALERLEKSPLCSRDARDPVDPARRDRRNPAPIWKNAVSEALK
jgi:hypothetical protein